MLKFRKRIREIGPKHSSLSGFVSSIKLRKEIQFESSLERDFIFLQEFNEGVKGFLEQPFRIKLNEQYSTINTISYTPDFIIEYFDKNKPVEIVEVKYSNDSQLRNNDYIKKLSFVKKYCSSIGYKFRVYTEIDIRVLNETYLSNIKFLFHYRSVFENRNLNVEKVSSITPAMTFLLDTLEQLNETTIKEFLEVVVKKEHYSGEYLFYLWYLVANKFISCDLQKPLGYSSVIWRE